MSEAKTLRAMASEGSRGASEEAILDAAANEIDRLTAEIAALREGLSNLVNAKALSGVRAQVAGWNGDGKPGAPYERHPNKLGANLPKTNCGAVYDLDDVMSRASALLEQKP